ncbi:MAG: PQQ-dependent sugar dehydrogenase [Nitrososphaera sp.]|nr:PQQ-dependent sugar dehydrogenase [Nitrososphaera sp.]
MKNSRFDVILSAAKNLSIKHEILRHFTPQNDNSFLFFSSLLVLFASFSNLSGQEQTYTTSDGVRFKVETVLSNLEIPWSIAFDKVGNLYFTERPGRLQVLKAGATQPTLIADLDQVRHRGEGGLMGLALHPEFESNGLLYVSYTFEDGGDIANRVVRYRLRNGALSDFKGIGPVLPGSSVHNGCRIKFGPDGKLYVTAGDAANRTIAQDRNSLGGKILRMNDDGSVPTDNPAAGSYIYALGFRNPQGIAWHPDAKLMFETEHGPSGFDGPGGGDEVNIVEAGKNYGWPAIHHREQREGMESPLLEYTPAIAPASAAFYSGKAFPRFKNNFFFGCLRGTRIQRIVLDPENPRSVLSEESLLPGDYRRIREVVVGPDGYIYFSTSNQDGRARPFDNDDRILRIVPVK